MVKEIKPKKKDESKPDIHNFFDDFWPMNFRRNNFGFFDEIEKQFKRMNQLYSQAIQGNLDGKDNQNVHFYGWTYRIGPDGQPHFQEFGNLPEMLSEPQQQIQEPRKPHIDIQEGDKEIYITTELPGVEKEDIVLEISDNILYIQVVNDKYPYKKEIDIKTPINEKNIDATYNNGILSITLQKNKPKKKGKKINIK
ncbi:MAG: archaeal heat shock protein Hsp20 [Promethearchaeota archaeon]